MATVTLDKIQSAELCYEGWRVSRIRTAIIHDVDISAPSLVLEAAFIALQGSGITYGVGYPNNASWRLQTIQIVPLSGNTCRAILRYATVDWGQSTYLVRDNCYLTSISTQLCLGPDKTPFRVSRTGSADPTDPPILEDSVSLSLLKPTRSIEIVYHSYGQAPSAPRPYVGYVNSDNFLSLDPGFWLFTKFNSDVARYNSSFVIEAEITTKNDEDWRAYGILQDKTTGRYAKVDDVVTVAKARAYAYGLIYPTTTLEKKNGLLCVGPYQMTSFSSLFSGIGGSNVGT